MGFRVKEDRISIDDGCRKRRCCARQVEGRQRQAATFKQSVH
jgi:hypothetical protein